MCHSALERPLLVRLEGCTTVALASAIGMATRRCATQRARAAGYLRLFQSTLHLAQVPEAVLLGRPDWDIGYIEMPEPDPDDCLREFIGTFDERGGSARALARVAQHRDQRLNRIEDGRIRGTEAEKPEPRREPAPKQEQGIAYILDDPEKLRELREQLKRRQHKLGRHQKKRNRGLSI